MSFQEPVFWTDAEDAAHRPYSVSEITSQVKGLLEENLPKCWVEGEISQYNHHSSGHRYFTIKDNASQLSAVMFKWQANSLSFSPQQGMQVQVYGAYLRVRTRRESTSSMPSRSNPLALANWPSPLSSSKTA